MKWKEREHTRLAHLFVTTAKTDENVSSFLYNRQLFSTSLMWCGKCRLRKHKHTHQQFLYRCAEENRSIWRWKSCDAWEMWAGFYAISTSHWCVERADHPGNYSTKRFSFFAWPFTPWSVVYVCARALAFLHSCSSFDPLLLLCCCGWWAGRLAYHLYTLSRLLLPCDLWFLLCLFGILRARLCIAHVPQHTHSDPEPEKSKRLSPPFCDFWEGGSR